jgi:hypothetical protein
MANLDERKEEIRSRLPLPQVVQETVELRRSGDQWSGQCPFHDDRSASLSVSENLFFCHAGGCGATGDVFAWLERVNQCDFVEALRIAAQKVGLAPLADKPSQSKPKANPDTEKRRIFPRSLAEQFNQAMPPERRQYYHDRGLSDETIDHFLLGWDGTRYTIPIINGGELVNVRRRRDDVSTTDKSSKMLPYASGLGSHLFNADTLKSTDTVIVTEGEFDAMLLEQHGWRAVSGTAGAGTWKADWTAQLKDCQTVYVVYDNDVAGRAGAESVAKSIGERARIVTLPDEVGDHGDVTDFFVRLGRSDADFLAILEDATSYAPVPIPADQPLAVHLAHSARSGLVGKKVAVKVLIAGKLDSPYVVPRKVRYTCFGDFEGCKLYCTLKDAEGTLNKDFGTSGRELLEGCHQKDAALKGVLRKASGANPICRRYSVEVLSYANVEELLAVPMADRVAPNRHNGIMQDDTGNEYVARNLYLVEDQAEVNQYYELAGYVYPHPKTQMGTIQADICTPLQDNVSQFQLTPEIIASFTPLQLPPDASIIDHVNALLVDLTDNVTHIYKREEALLAVLLVYHSALNFVFQGETIGRGWLEAMLVGDTGVGKSVIVRSVLDFCGMGVFASGETASRTGLTYAVEQVGERWFVKWGKYALADRRLLVIDEMSELRKDDLGQMTQGRNDGVLTVDRAAKAETNCRTRLIWMSNPQNGKQLFEFTYGVQSILGLFPAAADLRRLDLAVFFATKDVDMAIINQMHPKPPQQIVSSEMMKHSVLWAWSRIVDDIVLADGTEERILSEASRLGKKYGAAEDIPLVSPADMRKKLVRMAVALAAFLHSTDVEHQQVIVLPLHAEFVSFFLDNVYSARNCRYDVYAGAAEISNTLTPEVRAAIDADIEQVDTDMIGERKMARELINLFRNNDTLGTRDIADMLDADNRTVTKRLRLLMKHSLLRKSGRNSQYKRTARFTEYLLGESNQDGNV